MRRGCIAIALAACHGGNGIEIDVHESPDPSAAVDRIALVVGLGDSTTGATLVLDRGLTVQNASYWQADPGNGNDSVSIASDAVNRSATFRYEAGDGYTELGAVIALGYQGSDSTLTSATYELAMPFVSDAIARYDIGLNPGGEIGQTGGGLRANVHLWGPQSTDQVTDRSCVAFEEPGSTPLLIVNSGDEDCDGFPTSNSAIECRPDIFRGSRPPGLSHVDHVTKVTLGPATAPVAACVLSGPGCIDGTGNSPSVPTSYCAPQSLCNVTSCADPTLACTLPATIPSTFVGARIMCPIRVVAIDPAATNGFAICQDTGVIDLSPLTLNAPITCASGKFIGDGTQPFAGALQLQSTVANVSFQATYAVAPSTLSSCSLTLMASGTVPPAVGFSGPAPHAAMVAQAEQSGARGIALPIDFEYQLLAGGSVCGASTTLACSLYLYNNSQMPVDGLAGCLSTTPAPGTRVDGK